MPPHFIARQLSHPNGVLGRLVALLMNRHNAKLNTFAFQQLELVPEDRVLEIGFGGGIMLEALLQRTAFVGGLDRSEEMVKRANARFSTALAAGRADFRQGLVDSIPFATAAFTKVCTINTVYFWPSLDAAFTEMHRVLSPGGRVVVGFLPKEHMDRGRFPADIFTSRTADDVMSALSRAGFQNPRPERPTPATPWNVIVATC